MPTDKRTPKAIGEETRTMSIVDFYSKWSGRTNPRGPKEAGFVQWVSDLYAVKRGGAEEAVEILLAATRKGKS